MPGAARKTEGVATIVKKFLLHSFTQQIRTQTQQKHKNKHQKSFSEEMSHRQAFGIAWISHC